MARNCVFLALLLCFWIAGVIEGKECSWQDPDDSYEVKYKYCTDGCCGSSFSDNCCDDDLDAVISAFSGAAIAGIVIGSLLFIAAIVSVVICIVCCLRKSRGGQGHVVRGQGTTVVTSASPYPTAAYGNQAYNTGQPAFIQTQPAFNQGPPEYNQMQMYPANTAAQPPANQPQSQLGSK